MLRIHFTAGDLARVRLSPTAGPYAETVFALGLLARGGGTAYARWRRQAASRMPQSRMPHLAALPPAVPDALLRAGRPQGPPAGQLRRVEACLPEVWRIAVAPYWDRLLGFLEAECDARGRTVMAGGVEQLLATLHPRIRWCAPVLEIHGAPDEDVRLDGNGLVISPSVFLGHRPGQLVADEREDGRLVLAVSAPLDADRAADLWGERATGRQSLGALVGQTRAAALRALRASCTTSQLADRLGISVAGASQHTAVLRQTGLITTRRVRNTVFHSVTPLGVALLDGRTERPARTGTGRSAVRLHRDPHPAAGPLPAVPPVRPGREAER
ncbi:helix-turn-helix domain-containing protein [Kitasatospora sp. NPDC097605]|uniref:ArsR/SmtB family transcription factor n=1 Tax=Kitasatospora sp. NPDC097605 TaxID=3157226 RepID=UPI0033324D2B